MAAGLSGKINYCPTQTNVLKKHDKPCAFIFSRRASQIGVLGLWVDSGSFCMNYKWTCKHFVQVMAINQCIRSKKDEFEYIYKYFLWLN